MKEITNSETHNIIDIINENLKHNTNKEVLKLYLNKNRNNQINQQHLTISINFNKNDIGIV